MTEAGRCRLVPRTDRLLALAEVTEARARLSEHVIREVVRDIQQRVRQGLLPAEGAEESLRAVLAARAEVELRPVLNATGVIVHTNLGRAPLSGAVTRALMVAAGYVDLELDLTTGTRSRRGDHVRRALLSACPAAEDALVVNNGAAAMMLTVAALAADLEVVVSRGELIEIGAGFRLPDLVTSVGAQLREVGATNRTHQRDYAGAIGPGTGCVLKVHRSNFRIEGFACDVSIDTLRALLGKSQVPLVADLGSGLLVPDPVLPDEPDVSTALRSGADLVIISGDKLLGGPQSGLILGRRALIKQLAHHPLARAVRADKLTLAALEATLSTPGAPVAEMLRADPDRLAARAHQLANAVGADVVPHDGRVGGGGAPGVRLPGWAVRLPEAAARPLRTGLPAVLPRVHDGYCLIDPRCVPESDDEALLGAVQAALASLVTAGQ